MARPQLISDSELMERLSFVFRDVGYAGASLSILSEATGLKKASLYHRFPNGKEQMALEVLEYAGNWLNREILTPLKAEGSATVKIAEMSNKLSDFYSEGRQACLLNMLSSSHIHQGPFTHSIKQVFEDWTDALTRVVEEAGFERKTAKARAERAIILLQGSLVLSRGTGSIRPFKDFLSSLSKELLDPIVK